MNIKNVCIMLTAVAIAILCVVGSQVRPAQAQAIPPFVSAACACNASGCCCAGGGLHDMTCQKSAFF